MGWVVGAIVVLVLIGRSQSSWAATNVVSAELRATNRGMAEDAISVHLEVGQADIDEAVYD